jgi:hypothetical protein
LPRRDRRADKPGLIRTDIGTGGFIRLDLYGFVGLECEKKVVYARLKLASDKKFSNGALATAIGTEGKATFFGPPIRRRTGVLVRTMAQAVGSE